MTDRREPEGESDALDAAYRRASAADASRPSEQTRAAILANARAVAATAREQSKPAIDTRRPAANDPFWWRSAAASVAIAVVGLMIWAPRFQSGSVQNAVETTATPQEPVASAPAEPPTSPPPTAADLELDRAVGSSEQHPDRFPAPLGRIDMQTRLAKQAAAPFDTAPSTAAAAPVPSPVLAKPTASASMSAGASARAAAPAADPVADAAPGAAPAADARAAAPGALPPAPAHKAELQEIVVTGGRARAGTASPSPAAAPAETYARQPLANLAIEGAERHSELDAAIARGDAERVRELVAPQGALEARDARGRTPLMRAVVAGQAAVVRALLAAGADPNAADAEGVTPRARAATRADIAALLEERAGH